MVSVSCQFLRFILHIETYFPTIDSTRSSPYVSILFIDQTQTRLSQVCTFVLEVFIVLHLVYLNLPIIYHCRCLLSTSRRGLIDIGFILVDWRCLRIDYYEVRKLVHLFLFDCSSIHRVYSLSIINIPINSTDILWKNNAV